MMDAFARWLVRHPVAVLTANLLVTFVLGAYAVRIRVESSLQSVLPKGVRKRVTTPREFKDALKAADLKQGVRIKLIGEDGRRFEVLKDSGD